MSDVMGAFVGHEQAQGGGDERANVLERPGPSGAQERLQLGKREFDRIEIGTVGRQEPEVRADGFDCDPNLGLFVSREIIEHDDIAGAQRRREDLLDVRQERRVVDRAIKDRRCHQAVETQRRNHGVRLPVTAGRVIAESRAHRTAPIAAQQVGGHATFVEKYILADITQRLPGPPVAARRRDIRPTLFGGVYRFF